MMHYLKNIYPCLIGLFLLSFSACDKEKMYIADNSGSWQVENIEVKTMEGSTVVSDTRYASPGYILLYNNGVGLSDENICLFHFDTSFNSKGFHKLVDAGISQFDGQCFWASGPNLGNRITLHADGQIGKVELSFTVETIDHNRAKWHYIETNGGHYYRETFTVYRGK